MAQTIGRVIRVHKDDRVAVAEGKIPAGAFHLYKKSEGVVTMPTGYKMGNAIAQRLQNVVNQIFLEGIPLCLLLMCQFGKCTPFPPLDPKSCIIK